MLDTCSIHGRWIFGRHKPVNSPGLVPRACEILSSSLVPCPGLFFLFFLLFLEHPWGHWIQKCAPRRIPGGSLADPWRLPGGLPLWVATFCTLKKRRVLPFDLRLGGARTDQGPQLLHYIRQLTVFCPTFGYMNYFFMIFLKMCSPPTQEAQF